MTRNRTCHRLRRQGTLLLFLFALASWGPPASAETQVFTYQNIGPAELSQIKTNMIAAGYSEADSQRQISALKLDGKTVFQVGTSIFVGNKNSIVSGNYRSGGIDYFTDDKSLYVLYYIDYKDHRPQTAYLSDGRIIEFKGGSPYDFVITLRSQDGQREYVAEYKEGQVKAVLNMAKYGDPKGINVTLPDLVKGAVFQRSWLHLKEFGATLSYDYQGNLTGQSLAALQRGGGDFTYATITGRDDMTRSIGEGFALKSKKTGREEMYTFAGRRILPAGRVEGIRETTESDTKQNVTLNFAKYDNINGLQVTIQNIYKVRMEVFVSKDRVSRVITRTRELCDLPELIQENGVVETERGVMRWIAKSKPSFEKYVTGVRFYESGEGGTPYGKRTYSNEFAQADTRFIYCELNLMHPDPGKRIDFILEAVWLRADGSTYAKQAEEHFIEPDWKASFVSSSRGSKKTGTWAPGPYIVELYIDNKKIATGTFTVR